MSQTNYVLPVRIHNDLISAAFRKRGYDADESAAATRMCEMASWHGVKTHNGLKALHIDKDLGSGAGGSVPGAKLEVLPSKYKAVQRWNANRKQAMWVAFEAMKTCMKLADEYGVGVVAVDNAFHYLWGGGYVIDAANKGYIAYTNCTAGMAEVVPFQGKYPTLGTNPQSIAFPTQDIIGFPICVDWATSVVASGRVSQYKREGKQLPPNAAVDKNGNYTTDPNQVAALVPFGAHKGYGLALIDELFGAYIGGSLPTLRSMWGKGPADEKHTPAFYFQCLRPDAISGEDFAQSRTQSQNIKAVLDDILGHGNENCMLPGQLEAQNAKLSAKHDGLLFTPAEIEEFVHIAEEGGVKFDRSALKKVEID